MNKRDARRNLILAGLLIVASVLMIFSSLAYVQFFMRLPR